MCAVYFRATEPNSQPAGQGAKLAVPRAAWSDPQAGHNTQPAANPTAELLGHLAPVMMAVGPTCPQQKEPCAVSALAFLRSQNTTLEVRRHNPDNKLVHTAAKPHRKQTKHERGEATPGAQGAWSVCMCCGASHTHPGSAPLHVSRWGGPGLLWVGVPGVEGREGRGTRMAACQMTPVDCGIPRPCTRA